MTETERIRWVPTRYGGWTGHVGTMADTDWLFQIWSAASMGGDWQLDSTLPGKFGQHSRADDPATLKADAEFMLSEFVSSLGAVFADAADCTAVTRFEVIDHTTDSKQLVSYSPDVARSVVARPAKVALSFQDDGRTLKVFLTDPETTAGDSPVPAAGEGEQR